MVLFGFINAWSYELSLLSSSHVFLLYNKGLTMTTKGKKLTYNWGDEQKTITQILSDPQHMVLNASTLEDF